MHGVVDRLDATGVVLEDEHPLIVFGAHRASPGSPTITRPVALLMSTPPPIVLPQIRIAPELPVARIDPLTFAPSRSSFPRP